MLVWFLAVSLHTGGRFDYRLNLKVSIKRYLTVTITGPLEEIAWTFAFGFSWILINVLYPEGKMCEK